MIDKSKIARSFSRCALSYDAVAYFQRETGQNLLSLLAAAQLSSSAQQRAGSCLVDLGCGTGYFGAAVQASLPQLPLLNIDLAEGMLRYVREHHKGEHLVCADAEQLPLAEAVAGVIFSNLAVQWCENLAGLLRELHRVLAPGGVLAFSTLGPQTLFELKQAWAQIDTLVHVNQFQTLQNWNQAIAYSGLQVLQARQQTRVLYFEQLRQLAQELKSLGAHNMNSGQRQSLTSRRDWLALQQAYHDMHGADKGLPASYEVYYWLLQKKPSGVGKRV